MKQLLNLIQQSQDRLVLRAMAHLPADDGLRWEKVPARSELNPLVIEPDSGQYM